MSFLLSGSKKKKKKEKCSCRSFVLWFLNIKYEVIQVNIIQYRYFLLLVRSLKDYYDRMFEFFIETNLISKNQSGYRVGDSCINQLLSINHEIYQSLDDNGQVSPWVSIEASVLQGSIRGPLLFFIYINDLSDGLSTSAKLFADNTYLFSIVQKFDTSGTHLNSDLSKISNLVF